MCTASVNSHIQFPLNPHNVPTGTAFYRWSKQDTERSINLPGSQSEECKPLRDYHRMPSALKTQTQKHPLARTFPRSLQAFTMLSQTLHLSASSKWGFTRPLWWSIEKSKRFLESSAELKLEFSLQQLVLSCKSRWLTLKSAQNQKLAQTSRRSTLKKNLINSNLHKWESQGNINGWSIKNLI